MYINSYNMSAIGIVRLNTDGPEPKIHVHLSDGGMVSFSLDEWKELTEKVAPLIAKAEAVKKALAELESGI